MIDYEDLKQYCRVFLHVGDMDTYDQEIEIHLPVVISQLKAKGVQPIDKGEPYYDYFKYVVAVGVTILIDNESNNLATYRLMYKTGINELRTVQL